MGAVLFFVKISSTLTANSSFASDELKSGILCLFERKSLILERSKNFKVFELTASNFDTLLYVEKITKLFSKVFTYLGKV